MNDEKIYEALQEIIALLRVISRKGDKPAATAVEKEEDDDTIKLAILNDGAMWKQEKGVGAYYFAKLYGDNTPQRWVLSIAQSTLPNNEWLRRGMVVAVKGTRKNTRTKTGEFRAFIDATFCEIRKRPQQTI